MKWYEDAYVDTIANSLLERERKYKWEPLRQISYVFGGNRTYCKVRTVRTVSCITVFGKDSRFIATGTTYNSLLEGIPRPLGTCTQRMYITISLFFYQNFYNATHHHNS